MTQQRQQAMVVLGVLALFIVSGVGASWWGGRGSGTGGASAAQKPVKKFRAKPGTERKNVQALVSSTPSVKEETTSRPIDVWGSLDPEDHGVEDADRKNADAIDTPSAKDEIDAIRVRLAKTSHQNAEDSAELNADLAYLLVLAGEYVEADAAFDAAHRSAKTAEARVEVARVHARALVLREEYARVIDITEPGRFVGAELSGSRLEVEMFRAMAFEHLGDVEKSREVYSAVFEAALHEDLKQDGLARSVTRQAALRLARIYRASGKSEYATGVSRRLRAWLGEERLVLR